MVVPEVKNPNSASRVAHFSPNPYFQSPDFSTPSLSVTTQPLSKKLQQAIAQDPRLTHDTYLNLHHTVALARQQMRQERPLFLRIISSPLEPIAYRRSVEHTWDALQKHTYELGEHPLVTNQMVRDASRIGRRGFASTTIEEQQTLSRRLGFVSENLSERQRELLQKLALTAKKRTGIQYFQGGKAGALVAMGIMHIPPLAIPAALAVSVTSAAVSAYHRVRFDDLMHQVNESKGIHQDTKRRTLLQKAFTADWNSVDTSRDKALAYARIITTSTVLSAAAFGAGRVAHEVLVNDVGPFVDAQVRPTQGESIQAFTVVQEQQVSDPSHVTDPSSVSSDPPIMVAPVTSEPSTGLSDPPVVDVAQSTGGTETFTLNGHTYTFDNLPSGAQVNETANGFDFIQEVKIGSNTYDVDFAHGTVDSQGTLSLQYNDGVSGPQELTASSTTSGFSPTEFDTTPLISNGDTLHHDWQHVFTEGVKLDSNGKEIPPSQWNDNDPTQVWAIRLQGIQTDPQANQNGSALVGFEIPGKGEVYMDTSDMSRPIYIGPHVNEQITLYDIHHNEIGTTTSADVARYEDLTDGTISNFAKLNELFKEMTPHNINATTQNYPTAFGYSTADSQDRDFSTMHFGHAAFVQAAEAKGLDVHQGPLFANKLIFAYAGTDNKTHVIAGMQHVTGQPNTNGVTNFSYENMQNFYSSVHIPGAQVSSSGGGVPGIGGNGGGGTGGGISLPGGTSIPPINIPGLNLQDFPQWVESNAGYIEDGIAGFVVGMNYYVPITTRRTYTQLGPLRLPVFVHIPFLDEQHPFLSQAIAAGSIGGITLLSWFGVIPVAVAVTAIASGGIGWITGVLRGSRVDLENVNPPVTPTVIPAPVIPVVPEPVVPVPVPQDVPVPEREPVVPVPTPVPVPVPAPTTPPPTSTVGNPAQLMVDRYTILRDRQEGDALTRARANLQTEPTPDVIAQAMNEVAGRTDRNAPDYITASQAERLYNAIAEIQQTSPNPTTPDVQLAQTIVAQNGSDGVDLTDPQNARIAAEAVGRDTRFMTQAIVDAATSADVSGVDTEPLPETPLPEEENTPQPTTRTMFYPTHLPQARQSAQKVPATPYRPQSSFGTIQTLLYPPTTIYLRRPRKNAIQLA